MQRTPLRLRCLSVIARLFCHRKRRFCHRERRFCHRKRRFCHRERSAAISPFYLVIVRLICHRERRFCHRERSAAISVFHGWPTKKREIASRARTARSVIASVARRSRLSRDGKQKREIASQARTARSVIARYVAISVVQGCQTEKRDCFAGSQ